MSSACSISGARRRGFTLGEILVAIGIGFLLVALSFRFMQQTWRFVMRGTAQAELQQMATLALYRLEKAIEDADQSGISWSRTPTHAGLGVHGVAEISPQRKKLYKDKASLYLWSPVSRRLHLRLVPASDVYVARQFSPAQIQQLFDIPDGSESNLCSDVSDFQIDLGGARFLQPLLLKLHLRRGVGGTEQTYLVERHLCLRNVL